VLDGESPVLCFAQERPPGLQIDVGPTECDQVKRYSHLVVDHKAKVIEKMIAAKGL